MDKFNTTEGMNFLSNENLTCKDCILKRPQVGDCEAYEDVKPLAVLKGGECEAKVTE